MKYVFLLILWLTGAHIQAQVSAQQAKQLQQQYADMHPLVQQLMDTLSHRDVQVVALGEPTHGGREINTFRGEFIREAWRRGELGMIVYEAPLGAIASYHFYPDTRYEDEVVFWPWQSQELQYVMDSVRRWNHTHPDQAIMIAGLDPQIAGSQARLAQKILTRHFPEDTLDIPFDSLKIIVTNHDSYFAAIDILEQKMRERKPALQQLLGPQEFMFFEYSLIAIGQAKILEKMYLEKNYDAASRYRDSCMAVNMAWLYTHFGNNKYAAIIAHNLHCVTGNEGYGNYAAMGGHLEQYFGEKYYMLRTEFYDGYTWAFVREMQKKGGITSSGFDSVWVDAIPNKKDMAGFFRSQCPGGDCFLDYSTRQKPVFPKKTVSKQIGAVFYKNKPMINTSYHLSGYDGILFFHRITPFTLCKPLYNKSRQ